ncbi:MAG: hypothetical protein JW755_07645 [Candidatus Aminicenantes bacterium]|nr:hypothetical protein [Candidatus Aminicenantes bacterium]
MEFLVIAFIIISLVSSISKNIRKQMKKDAPFDPWSFDSKPSREDVEQLPEEAEAEAEEEMIEEEPEPAEDITVVRESLPETVFEEQLVEEKIEADSLISEEIEEESIVPPLLKEEKEYQELPKTGKPEEELKAFLAGRKLPLAIIASEVLGPPRAKLPYSYPSSRMPKKHF